VHAIWRVVGVRPVPFPLVTINREPIQYKGEELDPERGPGLGCFRFQLVVLVFLIVLTPLTVAWQWPTWISTVLLFSVILLLLVAGQTIIFLLRLVAADRRTRRRPLASATPTVGELDDAGRSDGSPEAPSDNASDGPSEAPSDDPGDPAAQPPSDERPVRQ
jgi:hypothetical protein